MTAPTVEQEEIDRLRVRAALLGSLLFESLQNVREGVSPRWLEESRREVDRNDEI
jgi:hypothetical protein